MKPRRAAWLLAAILAGAIAHPAAQYPSGPCGYIWIGGSANGETAYGWAIVQSYGSYCNELEVGPTFASVSVSTPWGGYDSWFNEGSYGYADAHAYAPLQSGESGDAVVHGEGAICLSWGCYYGEAYADEMSYPVYWEPPPPPPDPPTISFSPSAPITADYDSGDVIVTASISPSGQWESSLSWTGDGEAVAGHPLQRKFSSMVVTTLTATAVIPNETEATATVTIVPTVSLSPSDITVEPDDEEPVSLVATIAPSGYASSLTWSTNGDGQPNPQNHMQFFLSIADDGDFWVDASLSAFAQVSPVRARVRVQTPCRFPPLLGLHRGLVRDGGYTYKIDPAWTNQDEREGIQEAIQRWGSSFAVGAWFVEVPPVSSLGDLRIARFDHNQMEAGVGARVAGWIYWDDMTVRIAYIQYSDGFGIVVGRNATRRLGLHEFGHLHGLGDLSNTPRRSSVMNQAIGNGDSGGNIAEAPTACDVNIAQIAYDSYGQ